MTGDVQIRPQAFDDRYRLYVDESGDHVYLPTTQTGRLFSIAKT